MTELDDRVDVIVPRRRGARYFVRDILIVLVVAVLVSIGIKTFLIRSFYIPSGSMQNTLQVNDRIIVNELVPRVVPLQHGDVVVFTDPGGWLDGQPIPVKPTGLAAAADWVASLVGLSASDSNDHLIKRVIGLPGDRVSCCNAFGQMSVNGIPLDESAYVDLEPGETRVSGNDFSVTVPKDSLWVMGDNRYNSHDSRATSSTPSRGFVPMDDVAGRAFVITWPVGRWSWLDDYPGVFAGVDSR